jgi:uncharacterized protein (DUF1810 family)
MTDAIDSLDRFQSAQDKTGAGFATALAEIRAGGKRSHWIWYVFPQLAGLGSSPAARTYELRDIDEATAYLGDPVLGPRLLTIARAVADELAGGVPIEALMGSEIDVLKLVSSLTLFRGVAERARNQPMVEVAERILAAAEAAGHPRCRYTLERLAAAEIFERIVDR